MFSLGFSIGLGCASTGVAIAIGITRSSSRVCVLLLAVIFRLGLGCRLCGGLLVLCEHSARRD